ncbi:MAG: glutamate--cysteine ligase [Pseudonocardia sp.]|nr:glutamate--cysteine ligase [Pseudonocardia sp.]
MVRRSMGVEEEFLLVDRHDGRVRAAAAAAAFGVTASGLGEGSADGPVGEGTVEPELQLQQIETNTEPCMSLVELRHQLRKARRQASDTARAAGVEIAALGTSPLPADTAITPTPRYQRIRERFGLLAEEQLTCGCHIHVSVESDEEGVAVLDRIRPWLAPLLALSANSPFWRGEDSQYASYRAQVWSRWPSAGPTELFGSAEAYHNTTRAMTASCTLLDNAMIYFDARLSERYPTVEVRLADVCMDADDAVLLAALTRALVHTAVQHWRDGQPPGAARVELLRLASWRASRDGLDGELLDPLTHRPVPADTAVRALLAHVRDALEASGDLAEVERLLATLLRRGNGARQQRATCARTGCPRDVVAEAVRRTVNWLA